MSRKAKIQRKTKETNIVCETNLDGTGKANINTKIGETIEKNKEKKESGNGKKEKETKKDK